MKIGAAAVPVPRAVPRPVGGRDVAPTLPRAVANRLDGLLAGDPGLAEAVSARLPEARRTVALDLAASVAAVSGARVDLNG